MLGSYRHVGSLRLASTLIGTHAGLRGRPGLDLTEDVVREVVGGLVQLLRSREPVPSIALARDERPSGARLAEQVAAAAVEHGAEVVDLGVASTPTAKAAARAWSLAGAVVVTGSHLPPHLNGLKLIAAPLYAPVDIRELPPPAPSSSRGRIVRAARSAAGVHAQTVCDSVDVERIRAAGLAVDLRGGAGRAAELVLEVLGCARQGEPADVGLRLDADGDRLELDDERGLALDAEMTLPLVARARAARVAARSSDTSRMIDVLVGHGGGVVHVVSPGELHLARAVAETGADLAGEGNGGVMVPAAGPFRDGLAAAASVLELLATTKEPLSRLAGELPRFVRRRSIVPCADADRAQRLIGAVAERFGGEPGEPYDGVVVERDAAWGLVRLSATEPVLRVGAEAETAEEAGALHDDLRAVLRTEER